MAMNHGSQFPCKTKKEGLNKRLQGNRQNQQPVLFYRNLMPTMKTQRIIHPSFSLVALIAALLAAGCASNKELLRRDALKRDTTWPNIRAAAEMEIARREGTTDWSYQAYYTPVQHTNEVWIVVAEGGYPMGAYGDFIDLVVRDSGEVISAKPRKPDFHPKWK